MRLAIISEPETRGVADFLTLQLTSESGLALLERDQIDKILNEQKLFLGGFDFQGALHAGQLLRADGIVCIASSERSDATRDKPQKTLKCQLIAVNPGVMLWSRRVDVTHFDPSKMPELASQLGGAITRNISKLAVKPDAAIPLSIAHIRPLFKSAEGRQVDEDFNQGLVQRLSEEPLLFVLERHNLEMLSWEKDSTSGSTVPFWTGKSILHGTIEKDLIDPRKIIVKLTLQPPGGPATPSIAIGGSLENISALVEDSANAILAQLEQSSAASWDPVKEGERFAQSAEEAEKCGADWRYVKGQAGAAWALGNRSPPAVRMRILSHLRSIYGLSFSYPYNAYDAVEESTWSGMEKHLKAYPELTSEKLDAALDALTTFQKYPTEFGTDPKAITQLVEVPGQFLRILLLQTNWREHEDSIRPVQSLARAVCESLVNSKWARDQQCFALFGLKRDLAPYWCDNVKDVVSAYREILLIPRTAWFNQGNALSFRSRTIDKLLFGDESKVKRVAMTGENANAFAPYWKALLKDLMASADVENQAAGLLAAFRDRTLSPSQRDVARITKILESWNEDAFSRSYQQALLDLLAQLDPAQQRALAKRAVFTWLNKADATLRFPSAAFKEARDSFSLSEAGEIHRGLLKRLETADPSTSVSLRSLQKELEERFPSLRKANLASSAALRPTQRPEPLSFRKWGDPNEAYNFEDLTHGGRVWFSAWPNWAVVGLRLRDFDAVRIPLPPPRSDEESMAYGGARLVAVSDSWLVIQVTKVPTPWRFLIYDFRNKAWTYLEKSPACSQFLLAGHLLYGIYSDTSQEKTTGLLRCDLRKQTVEILSNSAGRGTIAAKNAPQTAFYSISAGPNGTILTRAIRSCWEFNPAHSEWRELPMRKLYEAIATRPREPEAFIRRVSGNYSEQVLHVLDPERHRFAAFPLKQLEMEDIAPPLSLSEGLFLHDDSQAAFVAKSELDRYMRRFGEALLKPLPLKALPAKTALVGVLDEYGARNLFFAKAGALGRVVAPHWRDSEGPKLSPNGRRILFRSRRSSEQNNSTELFTVDVDGSNLHQLTFEAAEPCGYAWSPDGSEIAFLGETQSGYNLFVMKADGSGLRQLTNQHGAKVDLPFPRTATDHSGDGCGVTWSPDGQLLAFMDFKRNLIVIERESKRVRTVASVPHSQFPVFSPDGSKLAFTTFRGGAYVVDVSGANLKSLAPWADTEENRQEEGLVVEHLIRWSPDGRQVSFDSRKGKQSLLCVADAATSAVSTLLEGSVICSLQWWPDGRGLYFEASPEVSYGVRKMTREEGSQLLSMEIASRKIVPISEMSAGLKQADPSPKITQAQFAKAE